MCLLWLLLLAVAKHTDIVKCKKLYLSCSNEVSGMLKKKVGVRGEKILYIASELSDTDLLRNMLPLPE